MQTISRDEARIIGLKRFFTGLSCIRGHIAERYVSTGTCASCHNEYFRKWKKEHPEKLRAIARATDAKNRDRRTAERVTNRDKFRKIGRLWYANNKDKAKEASKKWEAKNPDHAKTKRHNYRARKLQAAGKHGPDDIVTLFRAQNGKCPMPWCHKPLRKYHIDHIVALSCNGTNGPSNLQLLCPTCNWRKHSKDPIKFAQENGFLL